MTKHLVVVAGNIGVGKTSLTERVGSRLGWWTGYESVTDNPYLADFYDDMRSWSFHLQVFFLGHRADQYLAAVRDPRSAILDRSIFEDFHIFARALHHMGDLSERDYLAYRVCSRSLCRDSRDLVRAALDGRETPRVPVGPLAVHFCAEFAGVTVRQYTTSAGILADSVIRYYERFRPMQFGFRRTPGSAPKPWARSSARWTISRCLAD